VFLERSAAPTVLLIEDDEFDRMTLTRMLEESGCSVMATRRGTAAVHTFAIYHRCLSLVLASTGLSDAERIRLAEELYRVAPHVPVVMAARRASHRPNSGEDSGRSALFAALIAEVLRRLDETSARAEAQAESFARVQPPAPTSGRDAHIHQFPRAAPPAHAGAAPAYIADTDTAWDGVLDPDPGFFPNAATFGWGGSSRLKPVANLDPRSYLKRLSTARRARRRRFRYIGIAVAAAVATPFVVTPLLQMRTTTARAIADDPPDTLPPLASASISARVGLVPLVSSAHVKPTQPQLNRNRKLQSERR
jgi:CheY-like chemotaxis protein